VILSREGGYVVVHPPKTGGTSLALALEPHARASDLLWSDTPLARARRADLRGLRARGRLWKHSTLADLDGLVTAADLDRLVVVATVRNPWDRLVSYWAWLRRQSFGHPAVALARASSFSAFLNHEMTQAALAANPVRRYLTGADGRTRPALIVRIERAADDLGPFEAHLGGPLRLPCANAGERPRDWRPFYSDADAALVARLCAEDARLGPYAFDDAAACVAPPRP
jgi:hypothetical protein